MGIDLPCTAYSSRADDIIMILHHDRVSTMSRVYKDACKGKSSTTYGKLNVCIVGVGYSLRNLCVGQKNFRVVWGVYM